MNAGKLNRRITLQQRSPAQDASGQQATTWTDLFTVWAGIEPLTARELLAGQAVNTEVSHKVTVRYRTELALPVPAAALRASYASAAGTRIFGIVGVLNIDERRAQIDLLASEGLNQG
jgi:SPP1 family predicted phage head-tail adaptor